MIDLEVEPTTTVTSNLILDSLNKRKEELERRISEKDFSAEEYKEKKELNEKEKQAKLEYEKVKKEYDTLKKSSKEYIDNKAKQYLNQLRKKLTTTDPMP
jgi:hypothetical protein